MEEKYLLFVSCTFLILLPSKEIIHYDSSKFSSEKTPNHFDKVQNLGLNGVKKRKLLRIWRLFNILIFLSQVYKI